MWHDGAFLRAKTRRLLTRAAHRAAVASGIGASQAPPDPVLALADHAERSRQSKEPKPVSCFSEHSPNKNTCPVLARVVEQAMVASDSSSGDIRNSSREKIDKREGARRSDDEKDCAQDGADATRSPPVFWSTARRLMVPPVTAPHAVHFDVLGSVAQLVAPDAGVAYECVPSLESEHEPHSPRAKFAWAYARHTADRVARLEAARKARRTPSRISVHRDDANNNNPDHFPDDDDDDAAHDDNDDGDGDEGDIEASIYAHAFRDDELEEDDTVSADVRMLRSRFRDWPTHASAADIEAARAMYRRHTAARRAANARHHYPAAPEPDVWLPPPLYAMQAAALGLRPEPVLASAPPATRRARAAWRHARTLARLRYHAAARALNNSVAEDERMARLGALACRRSIVSTAEASGVSLRRLASTRNVRLLHRWDDEPLRDHGPCDVCGSCGCEGDLLALRDPGLCTRCWRLGKRGTDLACDASGSAPTPSCNRWTRGLTRVNTRATFQERDQGFYKTKGLGDGATARARSCRRCGTPVDEQGNVDHDALTERRADYAYDDNQAWWLTDNEMGWSRRSNSVQLRAHGDVQFALASAPVVEEDDKDEEEERESEVSNGHHGRLRDTSDARWYYPCDDFWVLWFNATPPQVPPQPPLPSPSSSPVAIRSASQHRAARSAQPRSTYISAAAAAALEASRRDSATRVTSPMPALATVKELDLTVRAHTGAPFVSSEFAPEFTRYLYTHHAAFTRIGADVTRLVAGYCLAEDVAVTRELALAVARALARQKEVARIARAKAQACDRVLDRVRAHRARLDQVALPLEGKHEAGPQSETHLPATSLTCDVDDTHEGSTDDEDADAGQSKIAQGDWWLVSPQQAYRNASALRLAHDGTLWEDARARLIAETHLYLCPNLDGRHLRFVVNRGGRSHRFEDSALLIYLRSLPVQIHLTPRSRSAGWS